MTSRFNKQWFQWGREARLNAEQTAFESGQPVYLPESSYNATAASYWRQGWNSITREELQNIHQGSAATAHPKRDGLAHIQHIKHRLGEQL